MGKQGEVKEGERHEGRNMDAGGICPHLIESMLCGTPSTAWPSVGLALVLRATPGPRLCGSSTAVMVKLPFPEAFNRDLQSKSQIACMVVCVQLPAH